MSGRTLNGNSFSNSVFVNTLSGGSALAITTADNSTSSTIDLKISKQDTQSTFEDTDMIVIEDASGNIKKVLGSVVKDSADGFFTKVSSNIYPDATSENLLLGTTSNSNSRKLLVVGDSEIQGDLYIKLNEKIISSNNSNDYLQFGNGTFTNNYTSNIFTNGISFGASADLNLATGRAITRGTDSNDRITFNSGNFTFGNTGIFNNGVEVKATDTTNSGFVSFFEASDNGTNNIDLHCPELTTHNYNAYLPKITDTNITNVYVLSNRNVLQGTNINISNSTTDTITINMDTTINGTITFTSTISGSVSGNAGTATKIASITNSNIVQLTDTQTLTNKTLKLPKILDTSDNHNYIFGVSELTSNRTITLPLLTGNDTFVFNDHSQTLTNKTLGNNTIFSITPTFNATLRLNGGTGLSGQLDMYAVNGLNFIAFKSPNTLSDDFTLTLPAITDTLVSKNSTDTLTNKTLGSNCSATLTALEVNTNPIQVKGTSVSRGFINFYDNGTSKHISLLSETAIGGSSNSYNLILPSIADTLITKTSTDNLTNKTLSSSTNTITTFTGNSSSTITTPSTTGTLALFSDIATQIASSTSVATTSDLSNTTRVFGNSSCVADIKGSSISVPTSINATPSGLSEGKIIQYDSGLGGGNGSMVFGDNGTSASTNWDTGIYAKQFINFKCGTKTMLLFNNTPANVSSTTFSTDNFNITVDSNNSYQSISYENNKPLMLLNTASSGTVHSHLIMKRDSSQSDYIILRQNNSDELLFHHENSGDDFVVGKSFEYGHKGAKWKYTDPNTFLYNPEDSNGASSASGSIMSFHKNGSVIFFNTTSTYLSGNTNYFSFAKSDDQQARITMDGNAQIAVAWLDSNDPSDRRIKYDIKDYENATAVIDKIKIKSFMKYQLKNFNNDNEGKMLPFTDRLGEAKYSIGVIAQEIADIPELAFMVEGSFEDTINPAYIHNYIPIISLLVKSNQEQQETINNLTNLVNEMKTTIDKLNNSTSFKDFKKM